MLLRRRGADVFYDMLQRKEMSGAAIRREQSSIQKISRKHKRDSQRKIIVEEMIIDEFGSELIPFDYKFYTFNGDVKFIVQVDRNSTPPSIRILSRRIRADLRGRLAYRAGPSARVAR
jgi:hypothetical protein